MGPRNLLTMGPWSSPLDGGKMKAPAGAGAFGDARSGCFAYGFTVIETGCDQFEEKPLRVFVTLAWNRYVPAPASAVNVDPSAPVPMCQFSKDPPGRWIWASNL